VRDDKRERRERRARARTDERNADGAVTADNGGILLPQVCGRQVGGNRKKDAKISRICKQKSVSTFAFDSATFCFLFRETPNAASNHTHAQRGVGVGDGEEPGSFKSFSWPPSS
jgi:hypothetical protein